MTTSTDSFPDLTLSGTAAAIATTWRVGDAPRQRLVADTIAQFWHGRQWPHPELLAYSVFGSVHGNTLLHYSQWNVADSGELHQQMRDRLREVTASVSGIQPLGEQVYRPYRSAIPRPRNEAPGVYVTVHAHFHQPHARRWVDGIFRASTQQDAPVPGLIGAHFHLSEDGQHMLNLAEWTDENAHQAQVEQPGGPVREVTRSAIALDRIRVERFQLLHHLSP